jgi:rubrerythrin
VYAFVYLGACYFRAEHAIMKRDFASLSAQEALHVAMFVEERNGHLYREFAELFEGFGDRDSHEIAAVFREMAEEEHRHGALLQERYFERYGNQRCSVTAEDICDFVELPQLDDASIFAIARAGTAAVPRSHALAVAIGAEKAAQRFYSFLQEFTEDAELRALYAELADFEVGHVDKLQHKLETVRRNGLMEEA